MLSTFVEFKQTLHINRFRKLFSLFSIMINVSLGLFVVGCSSQSYHRLVVNQSDTLLYEAGKFLEEEYDFELFKKTMPANLKLAESLWSLEKENVILLHALIKGYSAYGFSIGETEYLEVLYAEGDSGVLEEKKNAVLSSYARSIDYGVRYLKMMGVTDAEFLEIKHDGGKLKTLFDKKLNSRDPKVLESILFMAQSLGGTINLRKNEMQIVADLVFVKGLFDWVCEKNPNILSGSCDVFYGAYEFGRPKMLGGNPDKGKRILEDALKKHPHNWMIPAALLQFGSVPLKDEELFLSYQQYFDDKVKAFQSEFQYQVEGLGKGIPFGEHKNFGPKYLRAFQMIALKRYQLIKKYQKNLY